MHRLLTAGLVLSSLAFLFVTSASAEAISAFVDNISGGSARFDAVPQAGFGFYANASGTEKINCLGFYDAANGESGFVGDGLQAAHDVALLEFDGSNRVVIAEATIPAGDEATLSGGYRWVSIPEVTLDYTAQGADYYVLVASQGVERLVRWRRHGRSRPDLWHPYGQRMVNRCCDSRRGRGGPCYPHDRQPIRWGEYGICRPRAEHVRAAGRRPDWFVGLCLAETEMTALALKGRQITQPRSAWVG